MCWTTVEATRPEVGRWDRADTRIQVRSKLACPKKIFSSFLADGPIPAGSTCSLIPVKPNSSPAPTGSTHSDSAPTRSTENWTRAFKAENLEHSLVKASSKLHTADSSTHQRPKMSSLGSKSSIMLTLDPTKTRSEMVLRTKSWSNGPVASIREPTSTREEIRSVNGQKSSSTTEKRDYDRLTASSSPKDWICEASETSCLLPWSDQSPY